MSKLIRVLKAVWENRIYQNDIVQFASNVFFIVALITFVVLVVFGVQKKMNHPAILISMIAVIIVGLVMLIVQWTKKKG